MSSKKKKVSNGYQSAPASKKSFMESMIETLLDLQEEQGKSITALHLTVEAQQQQINSLLEEGKVLA